jgi:uncharacterized protein (TIGR03000 family)
MRSFHAALILAVVSLLGTLPSTARSQQTRPKMPPRVQPGQSRPMISPVPHPRLPGHHHRMGAHRPVIVYMYMPGTAYSSMYQMPYAMQGSYQMPYGGYGAYQMAAPGGYGSSSPYSSSKANQYYPLPTADDIEVSGPLDTPPPRRAIIRLRLPQTWADVSIDGRKVDCYGQDRTYVTPELTEARTFDVDATWSHNGRTVHVQDTATVEAGQIRTLDFRSGK